MPYVPPLARLPANFPAEARLPGPPTKFSTCEAGQDIAVARATEGGGGGTRVDEFGQAQGTVLLPPTPDQLRPLKEKPFRSKVPVMVTAVPA